MIDHPIFTESIQFIRRELGETSLEPLQKRILERMIHTSGDFAIRNLLRFSPDACNLGVKALKKGANILADTSMASVAIKPMSMRTINADVYNVLSWAPDEVLDGHTRTSIGMQNAWKHFQENVQERIAPLVVIGSSPTALEALLDLVSQGAKAPSLIIGMPVGFIGVEKSKLRLTDSNIPFIVLNGTRGGAALSASVVNALMRECIN